MDYISKPISSLRIKNPESTSQTRNIVNLANQSTTGRSYQKWALLPNSHLSSGTFKRTEYSPIVRENQESSPNELHFEKAPLQKTSKQYSPLRWKPPKHRQTILTKQSQLETQISRQSVASYQCTCRFDYSKRISPLRIKKRPCISSMDQLLSSISALKVQASQGQNKLSESNRTPCSYCQTNKKTNDIKITENQPRQEKSRNNRIDNISTLSKFKDGQSSQQKSFQEQEEEEEKSKKEENVKEEIINLNSLCDQLISKLSEEQETHSQFQKSLAESGHSIPNVEEIETYPQLSMRIVSLEEALRQQESDKQMLISELEGIASSLIGKKRKSKKPKSISIEPDKKENTNYLTWTCGFMSKTGQKEEAQNYYNLLYPERARRYTESFSPDNLIAAKSNDTQLNNEEKNIQKKIQKENSNQVLMQDEKKLSWGKVSGRKSSMANAKLSIPKLANLELTLAHLKRKESLRVSDTSSVHKQSKAKFSRAESATSKAPVNSKLKNARSAQLVKSLSPNPKTMKLINNSKQGSTYKFPDKRVRKQSLINQSEHSISSSSPIKLSRVIHQEMSPLTKPKTMGNKVEQQATKITKQKHLAINLTQTSIASKAPTTSLSRILVASQIEKSTPPQQKKNSIELVKDASIAKMTSTPGNKLSTRKSLPASLTHKTPVIQKSQVTLASKIEKSASPKKPRIKTIDPLREIAHKSKQASKPPLSEKKPMKKEKTGPDKTAREIRVKLTNLISSLKEKSPEPRGSKIEIKIEQYFEDDQKSTESLQFQQEAINVGDQVSQTCNRMDDQPTSRNTLNLKDQPALEQVTKSFEFSTCDFEKACTEIFKRLDTDGTGGLDRNGVMQFIGSVVKKMGMRDQIHEQEVESISQEVDEDHKKAFSLQELKQFLKKLLKQ